MKYGGREILHYPHNSYRQIDMITNLLLSVIDILCLLLLQVLQVLDTVKSLFCDDNSPFITVLAVDPHIIIKGIEHNLKSTFQV